LLREGKKRKRERTAEIVRRLGEMYPESRCSLEHEDAFQLVVATVLSAQCTDARVNMVTPELFARYPTPAAMAAASQEEMENTIRSINFFRNKSKALIGLGAALEDEHGGEVPADLDALTRLPGVGRKTANVVLGVGFGIADGVVVDTHVKRVAARLGLTRQTDPDKVEKDLLELLHPEDRVIFTHRIIDHGRAICVARTPRCPECALADICPSSSVVIPSA
jgi:endonuclease III